MIKIENIKVFNIAGAVYSARNAMNSWHLSDSDLENDRLGENDLKLAKQLSKAGTDHSKYLRMITVYMDITAPLYWWKNFSTYKVGTVANSCSTMHTAHKRDFTLEDFSFEGVEKNFYCNNWQYHNDLLISDILKHLNKLRRAYLETKDKKYWYSMIQLLPSSYNQKRTVMLNYQVLKNIYHARKSHKLPEWVCFCEEIKNLPYFEELCIDM